MKNTVKFKNLGDDVDIPEIENIKNKLMAHHLVLITGNRLNLVLHSAVRTIIDKQYNLENAAEISNKKEFSILERECKVSGQQKSLVLCNCPFDGNAKGSDLVRSLQNLVTKEGNMTDVIIVSEEEDLKDDYGLEKYLVKVRVNNFISIESPSPDCEGTFGDLSELRCHTNLSLSLLIYHCS